MKSPSNVLEIRIFEEVLGIHQHPLSKLVDTDSSCVMDDISVSVNEDRLEDEREHLLNVFHLLLDLKTTINGGIWNQNTQTYILLRLH